MPAVAELTPVERDKIEIDPNFDFRAIGAMDFDDIPANVMAMFKWCGVYSQLQKGFFMIRLVLPGGLITTRQFGRALDLAHTYARDQLCITTRQTLQFHWVLLPDIHKVLEGMAEVGITTKNGCGDVTRNTVTCSMQGVCPMEVGDDVRRLVLAIGNDPEIRDQQRNLPRKHKISVAGCGRACAQTLMNCQGWVPVQRQAADGQTELGWKLHAGGGLGARPYLGKVIFDWVPKALALDVARVTVEAFRRHGDRRNRGLARLKIVVDRMGAGAFGELLLDILKERGITGLEQIEPAADPEPTIEGAFLNGQAVIPQKQEGVSVVRVLIPRSELSVEIGRELCALADRFGQGEVMFTNRQNVELRHIPEADVSAVLAELERLGLTAAGNERLPDTVACVGTTQCKLAVADTPKACFDLIGGDCGNSKFWEAVGPLRIHMTGCPNNCAHAWIADIGLRGRRRRGADGGSTEGFTVYVGGRLSGAGRIAELLVEVDAVNTSALIRQLLEIYLAERESPDETFGSFAERVPLDAIRRQLVSAEASAS